MKIWFATSNKHKLAEFRSFLEPRGIDVGQIEIEIPEMRLDDVADVAREKAKYAAEKTGKTVVVEDSGIYISALKGFPGACSAFAFKTIGLAGILKLLLGAKDRSVEEKSAIALCEHGKEPEIFTGAAKGTIAEEPRGTGGFGYDPIFIPFGRTKTYAEEYDVKRVTSHRAQALAKLADYLLKNR